MKKKRLTVLLGAGASVASGAPSTAAVTDALTSAEAIFKEQIFVNALFENQTGSAPQFRNIPILKLIHRELRSFYQAPNFEHIIAALEELQAIASAHYDPVLDDEFIHTLAPFVRVDDLYRVLNHPSLLNFLRKQIVKLISSRMTGDIKAFREKNESVNHVADFISKLREEFSVALFTLNYDELADEAGGWIDGFSLKERDELEYLSFDRNAFLEAQRESRDLLVHLHGSVRFGFRNELQTIETELVKYESAEAAYQSLGTEKQALSGDSYDSGSIVSGLPIISGFNKVAKVNHSPAPYGYYYKALTDSLLTCHRLLSIGYGMADGYVNNWLREFRHVHGDHRRMGFVTTENVPFDHLIKVGALTECAASSQKKSLPAYEEVDQLALITTRFPIRVEDTLTRLFKFLDQD